MSAAIGNLVLTLPLLAPVAPPAPPGEQVVDRELGFRLELPEGWSGTRLEEGAGSLHLVLGPVAAPESIQLSVRAQPRSTLGDPETVRRMAESATKGEEYANAQRLEATVAGREVPAFQVDSLTAGGNWRLRQLYVDSHGTLFILQAVAPIDDFDERLPIIERVWASFELFEPELSDEQRAGRDLRALAARCGSEVDWAETWEEAARRARASNRLVLVLVRALPGFDISDETMGSTFMEPDIVELTNERYVPHRLKLGAGAPFEDQEVYGMSATTFGTGALLVTPDGEVVGETRSASWDFLREGIAAHPNFAGPEVELPGDPLERAALHARRGEVDAALDLLEALESARALRLEADLLRRLRRGEEALALLARAREAADAGPIEADLLTDEARVLLRLGRDEAGRARLDEVLERFPDHPRAPEARYLLGAVRRLLEGREAAEATWLALIADLPDDRWAWKAAATLTGTIWSVDRGARLDWPTEEEYAALVPPAPAPLESSEGPRAEREAIEWLLAHQLDDGSWYSISEFGRLQPHAPDDFRLAISAICGQALLGHRDREAPARAVERALDFALAGYAERREEGEEVFFLDYGVWSRAYLLWFLADCVAEGLLPLEDLRPVAASMVEELANKQRSGGGWSYYVTGDLGSSGGPEQSISFTTAAVVLALVRAREVGLEVPDTLLDGGLDCLEGMREERGTFEYMRMADGGVSGRQLGVPGAAGRGPVCALALYRGGRGSLEEIRATLELFVRHRDGLAKEVGKVLMHAGPDGQGSHYVLFDYATAAAALGALPAGERERFREPVLDALLGAHAADGTFRGSPMLGKAYGAGMGLLALASLRPQG